MTILSNASTNPKTRKKLEEFGYEAVIQHMCPSDLADGKHTVCAWSTPGCEATCLNTSGRSQIKGDVTTDNLQMYMIHRSRIGKTLGWINKRYGYLDDLERELRNLEVRADKKGLDAIARLNGTSDVPWEVYLNLERDFTLTQFYDYTKGLRRMRQFLRGTNWPANYHLTFSYSENTTPAQVHEIIRKGGNVAVVFRQGKDGCDFPATFMGHGVISGMEHDFRFLDKKGCIVGLVARGRAKKDTTGFVVDA
jgi:hypothetical protein